jgi:plasmid stability protein
MATITLKNIPDRLLEFLRKKASNERRSLNQEVIHLLEEMMKRTEGSERLQEHFVRQVEAWRRLSGRWRSSQSAAEEIEEICSARTGGRDVEL